MSHGGPMKFFDRNNAAPQKSVTHTRIDSISSIRLKYDISEDVLGRGSFGVVHKATDVSTGTPYAMKIIDKQTLGNMGNKMLEREVAILKKVHHPHIVFLEEVFETSEHTYLFMELCDRGELKGLIDERELTEKECAKITERLASAIAYLHDNDIVHRDLKMENILLSGEHPEDMMNLKVTDFGLSFVMGGTGNFGGDKMMTTTCGTPMYMAPEILDNCVGYSQQCDIWSIGVIMYMLLSRRPPFVADNEDELYERIKEGKISFDGKEWDGISESAKVLIRAMIKVDPASRITAKEIRDHPWVRGDVDDSSEDSSMTVIEMMKQFHRENHVTPPCDEIEEEEEDKDLNAVIEEEVVETPVPVTPKKCPPKSKHPMSSDRRRMSVDPNLFSAKPSGPNSPRRTSLPTVNGRQDTNKSRQVTRNKSDAVRKTELKSKVDSVNGSSPKKLSASDRTKVPKR